MNTTASTNAGYTANRSTTGRIVTILVSAVCYALLMSALVASAYIAA